MKKLCVAVIIVAINLLVSIIPSFAESSSKHTHFLTFESVYPKGHMRLRFVEDMLDEIENQSGEKIKFFRSYGKPARKDRALDALKAGNINLLAAYPTYYSDKVAIGGWQQLPGNFRNWQDCWDLCVNGEVSQLMDEAYQKLAGVKYIGAFPIGPYNFQVTKKSKRIRKIEDFKDLKVKSTSVEASEALKLLGALPVETIGGDYYKAMERGVIDAGLMTNYVFKQYELWKVCDEVIEPPFIGYAVGFIWMSLDSWNKLDSDLKKVVIDVARSKDLWNKWTLSYEEKQDSPIINEAKTNGVEFYTLSGDEIEKMDEKIAPVWDWYVTRCEKQGIGSEAAKIKSLIRERFKGKNELK